MLSVINCPLNVYNVCHLGDTLSKVSYNFVSAYIFSMGGPSGNRTPNPGNVNALLYHSGSESLLI